MTRSSYTADETDYSGQHYGRSTDTVPLGAPLATIVALGLRPSESKSIGGMRYFRVGASNLSSHATVRKTKN